LAKTKVYTADELSTYDLVHTDTIVLIESSVEKIQNRLN
jgi:ribosomal protein L4